MLVNGFKPAPGGVCSQSGRDSGYARCTWVARSALSNAARSIDEHRKTAERERELAKNYEKLELENLELKRAAAATGTAYFTKSKHQEVEFSEFGMRRGGKIIIFAGCVLLAYLIGLLT